MRPILIVDDDPAIAESTQQLLELSGLSAIAITKFGSISAVVKLNPSLVLLDIWMPDSDGREICQKLKADQRTEKVPVILISATEELATSANAVGADGFISKPFEIDTLLNTVKKYAV